MESRQLRRILKEIHKVISRVICLIYRRLIEEVNFQDNYAIEAKKRLEKISIYNDYFKVAHF